MYSWWDYRAGDFHQGRGMRIDLPSGTQFHVGPDKAFGKLVVPAWIEIHAGGLRVGRLVVRAASKARPKPGAFSPAWLVSP